ncbi:unnamed protein product [Larinioides sclopetarius]|uniref:Uncharacterized protein n=1 Tax=Larinioides sclopetarius TaxID=280406 RepID=A0AAV1Z450_9ARAC
MPVGRYLLRSEMTSCFNGGNVRIAHQNLRLRCEGQVTFLEVHSLLVEIRMKIIVNIQTLYQRSSRKEI